MWSVIVHTSSCMEPSSELSSEPKFVQVQTSPKPLLKENCVPNKEFALVHQSPREDYDAEELALEISDTIVAKQTDYDRILRDIQMIRAKGGKVRSIHVIKDFGTKSINLRMKSEYLDAIEAGEYRGLTCINKQLGGDFGERFQTDNQIKVVFSSLMHPHKLEEIYRKHADVIDVSAQPSIVGGGDDIRITVDENETHHYEFIHGWDGCLYDCMFKISHHYSVSKDGDILVP